MLSKPLEPLTTQPAVVELKASLGLIHGNHVAGAVDPHEGEVAVGLDLTDLLALVLVLLHLEVLQLGRGILGLSRPFESLGPGLVAEPVADVVGITGVDQDGDLLQETGDKTVVGLHPVTVEEEVTVDVKVARVVPFDLGTHSLADLALVQVFAHITHALVAEVARVLALAADIVDILSGALVGTDHGVVAVDRGGNANPGALRVIAGLDHLLAAGQGIVQGLAGALVQDSGVATLTAAHGTVVLVLSKTIGQTVTDENRLEVDVALLVSQDLRSEHGNVVTSIRLARNVEVLLRILGELLEEESEQRVDILASGNGVADGRATVGVADVDGLVKEDHGSVGVPGEIIVDRLDVLANAAGSKLQEQASERGAAGATVQPQNDRVVLGIVAGLEEPFRN